MDRYEAALNILCSTNGDRQHIIIVAKEAIEYGKQLEEKLKKLEESKNNSLPKGKRTCKFKDCMNGQFKDGYCRDHLYLWIN